MRISDWSFRRVLFRSRTCGGTAPRIAGPLAGACGRAPAFRRSLRCRGRVVASGATPRYRPRHATARRAARLLSEYPGLAARVGFRPSIGWPGRMNSALQKRSEEHTSELQSLMRNSYAVLCLKKKKTRKTRPHDRIYT